MNKKSFRPDTVYVREAFCPDVATMRLTERGQGAGSVPSIADELEATRARLRALRREHRKATRDIRDLKEAVAARDALIAIAGHELRNPMGAIVVSVTNMLFRTRGAEHLPPWLEPRLRSLDKQARNFVRRATTLLDVSRLTTGLPSVDRERVSLADIARDIVSELAGEAESAGCEVHLAVEDETVGWWDRAALEQVVLNLVSNAIKYGAGRPVDVSVVSLGGNAVIKVRDQGIGMPKPTANASSSDSNEQ